MSEAVQIADMWVNMGTGLNIDVRNEAGNLILKFRLNVLDTGNTAARVKLEHIPITEIVEPQHDLGDNLLRKVLGK